MTTGSANDRLTDDPGKQARLILSTALPRLVRQVDRVIDSLGRYRPERFGEWAHEMRAVSGAEGLALLAALPDEARRRIADDAELEDRDRDRLHTVSERLGTVQEPRSPAAALVRMFPHVAAIGDKYYSWADWSASPSPASFEAGSANELRLLFTKEADAFRVRAVSSGRVTGEAHRFEPFLTEEDFEDLRWYLEEYLDLPDGGATVRAERVEQRISDWGQRLFDAVFPPGGRGSIDGLSAASGDRLLTIASKDTEILRLPWELLADGRGPLTRQGVTIRRQLESAQSFIPHPVGVPLRILLVVSRPDDLGFIDPRLTTRAVLDAVKPLGDDVVVDFCRPPTRARMEEMLSAAQRRRQPYHIVHFDGHGTFQPDIELGALCFEKAQDAMALRTRTDHVRADDLGRLLAAYNIPLVILEACRSGQVGRTVAFRSVATRLIEAGVGSVLSMSHAVHVEAARVLLERFYRELVANAAVGQALEAGRAAMMANPDRWIEPGPHGRTVALQDWYLPHLYQRGGEDPRLVPVGEERFDVFLSHSHADSGRVEAIARQLRDRYGLKVWLDKWQLRSGPIQSQCEQGIEKSRIVLLVYTRKALDSQWVEAERQIAYTKDPRGYNMIPILLEEVRLPAGAQSLLWYDFRDPHNDADNIARLAKAIVAGAPTREARRQLPELGETGAFPRPPVHRFQGRASELYKLEQLFRAHRAILLHAMGGMGKTSLAGEAAVWWTRTGLFPDGACFLSFDQGTSADRVAHVLGAYLEGHGFEALPAAEQRRRARQLFQEKRVLMVWDNFESVLPAFQEGDGPALYPEEERGRIAELFRDWTEAADGHGRLLVTCRPAEAGLPGACKVELHGLARPDSLHLLARVAQAAGVDLGDPRLAKGELDRLLDVLADHPLSVELVGPHLKEMTPDAIVADFHHLLPKFTGDAEAERNRSLLASLAFSTSRLSPAARAALPWLGLFRGGVFEDNLLDVSGIEPAAWDGVRAELEATALVRVEREMLLNKRPYLRFHPTLAHVAAGVPVPDPDAARTRFVGVYLAVMRAVDQALGGSNARGGMDVMAGEEANFRTAVRRAVEVGAYTEAAAMGDTVRVYLERSGRLRERDTWVAWLASQVRAAGFTAAAAGSERDEAWSLFTQGQAAEAVRRLEDLAQRLRGPCDFDPAFQLALTQGVLGRIYYTAGRPGQAVPVLEDAVRQWEALTARKQGKGEKAEAERGNLATVLGDLANALRNAGRLDEALEAAERSNQIDRELGREHEVAAGTGQAAQILVAQGRHGDADERYDQALQAARRAGDRHLEGSLLQHQGMLARRMGQYARAANLYRRALKLFQDMNDEGAVMRTCNLLGVVEQEQGRLEEARTWYKRSREMAQIRGDSGAAGVAAQNLGIVCQEEGEAARARGDEETARRCFEAAAASVRESLRIDQELGNQPGAAMSHGQLAKIYLLLGDLDQGQEQAHQAREVMEGLGLKEVESTYAVLAAIARARGNDSQAAEWDRKRDQVHAELNRRAQGGGGLPPEFVRAVQSLAVACAQAGVDGAAVSPEAESALAQVEKLPGPLAALAPFLRGLASGSLPAVPADLPEPFAEMMADIREAVQQAREKS